MKIGDQVTWTSESQGVIKTKRGVIVAVVPAHTDPYECVPDGYRCGGTDLGSPRAAESYLIMTGNQKRRLYWPRVKGLHLDDNTGIIP